MAVYFKHYKSTSANPSFPSESQERLGRIVGIAEHKGDSLTFLVLDSVTTQVVARSELRSGLDSNRPSLRTILAPDGKDLSITSSCYGRMVLKRMNLLK
jgi:hypothetical protein